MPPDQSAQLNACPVTSDDLDVRDSTLESLRIESWSCLRPAWKPKETESSRCIWHTETAEKPPDALADEINDGDLYGAIAPKTDLTSLEFPPVPGFVDADLSEAVLVEADLSETNLREASLPKADLVRANLKEADLGDADLSRAELRDTNLSEALLAETDLTDTTLARSTEISAPRGQIEQVFGDSDDVSTEQQEDFIARANHELRTAYSANGLITQARNARVRERKARRKEAFAEGGLLSWGKAAWVGSWLSKLFTGYGVRLRWVVGMMLLLYLGSTLVYWVVGGMTIDDSLVYSIVTFTTSRSPEPELTGFVTRTVAGIETFAGTAAIVFLGYVLGMRERV